MKLKNDTALVFLVTLIFLDVGAGFLYYRLFNAVKKKNEHIASISGNIKLISDKDTNLRSIKNLVVGTEDTRAKINAYMIPKDGEVDFLNSLQALARSVGVTLSVAGVEETDDVLEKSPALGSLHVRLVAAGQWANIFQFVRLAELLPVKTSMTEAMVEYVAPSEKKKDPYWRAELQIEVLKLVQ